MSDLSPEIYEAVFYSIENPALVIDLNFEIRNANEAAADFLHYENRDHLIGTPVSSILVDPRILEAVAERVLAGERWVGECELMTADDRIFFGVGSAVPIEFDGELRALAGVFTDLTERRRHLHSLKILNRVLRHNIRNDINVVLGHVEQIATLVDDDAGQTHVRKIRDRLSDIVGDADTARQLEHLLSEQSKPVGTYDLGSALESTLDAADAAYEDAVFSRPADLGTVRVVGNDLIERVLDELVDNAVVHNDTATPHVDVRVDVNRDAVVVSVADDGPGVFSEHREMIFGREEVNQLHHGEGFSLFLVDQLMESFGGSVRVEDNDPRGAVFVLTFRRPPD